VEIILLTFSTVAHFMLSLFFEICYGYVNVVIFFKRDILDALLLGLMKKCLENLAGYILPSELVI